MEDAIDGWEDGMKEGVKSGTAAEQAS
jgi:hypothetical protein